MIRVMTRQMVKDYEQHLIDEEKSEATVNKYMHDLKVFVSFAGEVPVNKEMVIAYKDFLMKSYLVTSINSMLAGVNGFLKFRGWYDCEYSAAVKPLFRKTGNRETGDWKPIIRSNGNR